MKKNQQQPHRNESRYELDVHGLPGLAFWQDHHKALLDDAEHERLVLECSGTPRADAHLLAKPLAVLGRALVAAGCWLQLQAGVQVKIQSGIN